MNVFKSLGKLIWGDESNPELVQITSGQFYIHKPSIPRKCIYIDSMATIRRTSQPHQYLLAINRVFEEGEDDLQDESGEDLDDEKVFLIDGAMQFRKVVATTGTSFTWRGLASEDAGMEYEFVCDDDTTAFTVNNFEITTYQCMYERKHQKSHINAEDEAIEEFEIKTRKPKPVASKASTSKTSAKAPTSASAARIKKEKESVQHVESEEEYDSQEIDKPAVRTMPSGSEAVVDIMGELNLFDARTNMFMTQADDVRCRLVRDGKFSYWLLVTAKDGVQQLAQPLEPRMNPVFSQKHVSFIWNYFDDKHNVFSWLIRFKDVITLSKFQGSFGECMYEAINKEAWSKVSDVDQEYMIKTYQDDVEMKDADSSSQYSSEEEEEEEYYPDEEQEEEEEEEEAKYDEDESEDEEETFVPSGGDGAKNSQLAVGYKDRSFVVRGNKIGVFKHNDRDGLDFSTTIKNLSNNKGREVNPSKVLLHEQDTSMVMIDPRDLDTAYKVDLEYGKIVEEWNMPGTSGVLNLVGDSKYSHLTDNKTMIGLSKDAMFRIDPRLSGSKIVDSQMKQYAKGNNFTAAATTTNGSLAVAGAKGDIKLLNDLGKNAKTALPVLGDPILGLDVTGNGRWVIATCKNYILLIDVLNPENKRLGFDASFPAKAKPAPIKLHLKPEHVAAMKQPVSFTPARFNTGVNEEEKTIVASTGPYVITWNFRRVKNGHYDYQIKQYSDDVVADNFKFGQDRSIIVALPHDVTALPKRNLSSLADAIIQARKK
ncbi:hypothetical protein BGZ59_010812 [Podila verticillata]|nr:hypothetical protein BGZ59_010812 [Podila verticillata]KFH63741.1 hypothetical protein MVEG_10434 [Podila verticillata NRRL 6337]